MHNRRESTTSASATHSGLRQTGSRWGGRSEALMCTGSPRSGNGISTRSKSRGTITFSNCGPGLVAHLAAGVARRDVREREHVHAGRGGQLRRLGGGRVARLRGALGVLLHEGRLVHQQVGLPGHEARHVARRGVAGEDDLAAAARLPHHLVGPHAVHLLAALEPAEVGPELDAQLARALGVELARPRILDERVAERRPAVVDLERGDPVAVALELVVRLELDQLEREGEPPDHRRRAARTGAPARAARRR